MKLNNFSVLPWYTSLDQQNARKWWAYNKVYPLFTVNTYAFIPPSQLLITPGSVTINEAYLYDARTDTVTPSAYGNLTSFIRQRIFYVGTHASLGYGVLATQPGAFASMSVPEGQYYIRLRVNGTDYYSEVFTVVGDIKPFLRIEWSDQEDFVMDDGVIAYNLPSSRHFSNVLYLPADLGKPEYIFEEEGETRDGYFFPIKQISEKRYRFSFLASEYLLDVMRFIRMSDTVKITYRGQAYIADSFLITPEWEENGDVASVVAEFDTATVAKKIGKLFTQ